MNPLWDADMAVFRKAHELLEAERISSHAMEMVLFAMLRYGSSYADAVKLWADFSKQSPRTVRRELDFVVHAAGHEGSARALLNELYRKEVVNAYGVRAAEGS